MSRIHRVLLLNKPFKVTIFNMSFTPVQWLILVLALVAAFMLSTAPFPKEWKVANAPVGVFVFVGIVGAVAVLIQAMEMKPLVWWKNQILYRLRVKPLLFLPHPEPAPTYLDLASN